MRVLVTGSAGFIGFHVSDYLLKNNNTVIGIDNINNYYDVNLKKSRLKILNKNKNFFFHKLIIVICLLYIYIFNNGSYKKFS